MSLLTSKASVSRRNKLSMDHKKLPATPSDDDDRLSLFSHGFERAATALSSRPSITRRFRASRDYVKEEPIGVKFKHEVMTTDLYYRILPHRLLVG